jgi:hypothetical protein
LIVAGEPLGMRHTAGTLKAPPGPGDVFEVVRRDAAVVHGQLLAGRPVEPDALADLRAELGLVSPAACVLVPREILLSAASLPVAILEAPVLVPAREACAAWVEPLGRAAVARALLLGLAAMAESLGAAHSVGFVHGAVEATQVFALGPAPGAPLALAGFGLSVVGRAPGAAPLAPRRDLVDLVRALHTLLGAAKIDLEGAATVKWLLLRQAALHGEHPALGSGALLAETFRDLARLDTEEAPRATARPARSTTLAPARSSGASPRESAGRHPAFRPEDGSTPREPLRRSGRPPSPNAPPRAIQARPTVRVGRTLGLAAGLSVALVAVAGGLSLYNARHNLRNLPEGRRLSLGRGRSVPRCADESPASVQGVVLDGRVTEFDLACTRADASPMLVLLARQDTAVRVAVRPARHDAALTLAPFPVARGAVELGPVLAPAANGDEAAAVWFAWRNGVGPPLAVARMEGGASRLRPVSVAAWDDVPLHGAQVVWADADTSWLVTSVGDRAHRHSLLVALSSAPTHPPVIAWRLGDAQAVAAIPGPRPTVLLHTLNGAADGLGLQALTLDLGALAVARLPAGTVDPTRIEGVPLPARARTASGLLQITTGEEVDVVARGQRDTAGAAHFLLTVGARLPAETCADTGRCVGAGQVIHATFAGVESPVASVVAPRAWAEALLGSDGASPGDAAAPGPLTAVLRDATPEGLPGAGRQLVALGAPSAGAVAAPGVGGQRARWVRCGGELWVALREEQPTPRVTVRPAGCMGIQGL